MRNHRLGAAAGLNAFPMFDPLADMPSVAALDDDSFFAVATALKAQGLGHFVARDGSGVIAVQSLHFSRRPEKSEFGRSWRAMLSFTGSQKVDRQAIEAAYEREAGKAVTLAHSAVVAAARREALTEIGGPSTASYPTAEPRRPERRSYRRMR